MKLIHLCKLLGFFCKYEVSCVLHDRHDRRQQDLFENSTSG